jgi:putative hydrolase of the HAD superfamily
MSVSRKDIYEEKMIKYVIFDMGNVLLDYNPEVPLSLFARNEEDRAVIRKELFLGNEWAMMDQGIMTSQEAFNAISTRVPQRLYALLYQCLKEWQVCMKPLAGAEAFVKEVKQAGYQIYVLSNASTAFYEYFPKFLPISYFNGIMISADVKLLKPDCRIYSSFLEKYQLPANECLFIDDRQDNVDGALASGMQAVRFTGSYQMIGKILLADRKV